MMTSVLRHHALHRRSEGPRVAFHQARVEVRRVEVAADVTRPKVDAQIVAWLRTNGDKFKIKNPAEAYRPIVIHDPELKTRFPKSRSFGAPVQEAKQELLKYWDARRQKHEQINLSISKSVDFENLYDQPYEDNSKVGLTE